MYSLKNTKAYPVVGMLADNENSTI